MQHGFRLILLVGTLGLSACAGEYSGTQGGGGAAPGPGGGATGSVEEFFAQRVQPRLAFCRSCHVPGGIADVEGGRQFMLSSNAAQDLANLRASWERLGGNNPTSRILRMASGAETPHSGGQPWPAGSDAYQDMQTLLRCFENPAGCLDGAGGGPVSQEQPLLGSKHALHLWASYCEGRPDDAVLPADPRTLVRPGFNAGKAVYFNAYWEDCHANLPEAEGAAKTCGEYRARRDRGLAFLIDELPAAAMSAAAYNDTWKKWGLAERPADFDALYTLRYGLNEAPFHNPYPLPGEDPNATNGGSGRLPLGLRQLKDANGRWTGQIGTAACFQCHGGQIGTADDPGGNRIGLASLGLGNNNFDVPMNAQDNSPFAQTPFSSLLPALDINSLFNIGIKQRGQNNAVGAFEFLVTVLDLDSLGINPNPLKTIVETSGPQDQAHPLAHTQDTPPWWNFGSRPRKFFDAGVSNDSTRIIMAAGPGEFDQLMTYDGKPYRDRIEQYDQDLATYFLSLVSPAYPGAIDTALAEQGAILFHTKDLWAAPGNANAPRPLGGNGSCASCHGAYSPRYVNDPAYLENPALEGVAAHIAPLAVIDTDHARSDMLTPTLRTRWDTTFWGYQDNVPGYVAPEDKDPFTEAADDLYPAALRPQGVCGWEKDVIGYQAPPLYGVWATAPYFHNGSVPTVEAVLDSSKRVPIWRRKLQTAGPVTGFDQRLSVAYDFDALGWKADALDCTDIPGTQQMNCSPVSDQGPSLTQMMQNYLNQSLAWTGLFTISDPAPDAIDKRLVYDTRILGNGNGGHRFSDVLTDAERKAIIEYLKTL
ncbi:hypothetical protein AAG565_07150 [Fontimonas sp. SYSU GA230001]|uniref:putative rubber dioxygenase RoxC n=1 Tax=Fontimonas sp. SYSU GA230001 TaxID=3142450 RepID=UPI0032B49DF1